MDDFLNADEEGLTFTFPLGIVPLGPSDRLLVVDCGDHIKQSPTCNFEDRFEIANILITFDFFESRCGPSPHDLALANDSENAARIDEVQAVETTIAIVQGSAESDDQGGDSGSAKVPLDQAETLSYPCIACAYFDYYATGEGHTLGRANRNLRSAYELVSNRRQSLTSPKRTLRDLTPQRGGRARFRARRPIRR